MAWRPGESGNPSGRPKRTSAGVRALAQKYTRTAIRALVEVCKDADKDSARVAAAVALLNRGYGPAEVPALVEVPDDELRAEVLRRAELEDAGGDAGAEGATH